jgi:hypothetical protein
MGPAGRVPIACYTPGGYTDKRGRRVTHEEVIRAKRQEE